MALPSLGRLSLATMRTVVRTGANDDVLTEIATEKAEKRRRLDELRENIPVEDFVQLMLESLGKNDESGLTVCEQINDWCSLNSDYTEACDDAPGPVWDALMDRVFPEPIFKAFVNSDRDPKGSPNGAPTLRMIIGGKLSNAESSSIAATVSCSQTPSASTLTRGSWRGQICSLVNASCRN